MASLGDPRVASFVAERMTAAILNEIVSVPDVGVLMRERSFQREPGFCGEDPIARHGNRGLGGGQRGRSHRSPAGPGRAKEQWLTLVLFLGGALAALGRAAAAGSRVIGQEAPPNAPKFVKSVKAPGVDVRFLDFRWDEEAFATLEKGGTHPAGQQSWVLARLLLQEVPLHWKGRTIPVGPSLLVLNPAKGRALF